MNRPPAKPSDAEQIRRLTAQLKIERSRAAQLQAALVIEQEKVRALQAAYDRRDSEAWHKTQTIETLKQELRAIANTAASLQGRLIEVQARSPEPRAAIAAEQGEPDIAEPLSPAAEENKAAFEAALMDLEQRLQSAVGLVLDELNTRKAAEARIRQLEAQLASLRRQLEQGSVLAW